MIETRTFWAARSKAAVLYQPALAGRPFVDGPAWNTPSVAAPWPQAAGGSTVKGAQKAVLTVS